MSKMYRDRQTKIKCDLRSISGKISLCCSRALIFRRAEQFSAFCTRRGQDEFSFFSTSHVRAMSASSLLCCMPLICALCCSRATVVCALLRKSLIQRGEYSFFSRHFSFESLAQDVRRYHANQTSRLHFKDDGVQPSNGNGQIIRLLSTKELTKAQHAFQSVEQLSGFDARLPRPRCSVFVRPLCVIIKCTAYILLS